jgi:hypothetical protein
LRRYITASVDVVRDTRAGAVGEAGLIRQLPRLSCGAFVAACALAVDESESEAGEVLLLGGNFATDYNGVFRSGPEVGRCKLTLDSIKTRVESAPGFSD